MKLWVKNLKSVGVPQGLLPLVFLGVIFSGCADGIPRPDTDLCIANVQKKVRKCYNMARDYNDDGTLRKDAKPFYKPLTQLSDIDKNLTVDSEKSLGNLKAFLANLRDAAKRNGLTVEEEKIPLPLVPENLPGREEEDDELFQLPPGGLI